MSEQAEAGNSTLIDLKVKPKALPVIMRWVLGSTGLVGAGIAAWVALKTNVADNTVRIDTHEVRIESICVEQAMMSEDFEEVCDTQMLMKNDMGHMVKMVEKMARQVDDLHKR